MDTVDDTIESVRNVNPATNVVKIPLKQTKEIARIPLPGAGDRSKKKSSGEESTRPGLEWKKYLSGALSETQLKIAMIILCFFYSLYTLHNAYFLDTNERDEGDIIRNCTCKDHHWNFYVSLLVVCFTLWLICHSYYTLAEAFPAVANEVEKSLKAKYVQFCKKNDDETDYTPGISECERNLKKKTDQHIDLCKDLLWSQCFEMYAIGNKKNNKEFNLKEIKKLIARSLSPELCRKGNVSTEVSQDNTDSSAYDLSKNPHNVKRTILFLFHSFLVVVRFIAQLSVVPLLIVQMIDTYTLLCLAERDYCDRVSRYKLHLDQTALSFAFYCSLMISLLVTIWLNLVSQPKLEVCKCILHRNHVTSSARLEEVEANNNN